MLHSAEQAYVRIVYSVLGGGRMAEILGLYIGPFAALAGIFLLLCIVFYKKKKTTHAIRTGILSVFFSLVWKFAWVGYSSNAITWFPVIMVGAVVGYILFKCEKPNNRGETERLQIELERLRLEKERLELEIMRQGMAEINQDAKTEQVAQADEESSAPQYAVEASAPKVEIRESNHEKPIREEQEMPEQFKPVEEVEIAEEKCHDGSQREEQKKDAERMNITNSSDVCLSAYKQQIKTGLNSSINEHLREYTQKHSSNEYLLEYQKTHKN